MGFFSNLGSRINTGIGHIGAMIKSNIGHVTPIIHKIGEISRTPVGSQILSKIPYGDAIRKGINMADVAATVYDSTEGFKKAPSIEAGREIFTGIRGILGR